jgi:hypothetical protein
VYLSAYLCVTYSSRWRPDKVARESGHSFAGLLLLPDQVKYFRLEVTGRIALWAVVQPFLRRMMGLERLLRLCIESIGRFIEQRSASFT